MSGTESMGVPTLVVRVVADEDAANPRRRRKRNRPYNPRRHFEMDDYVAAHLLTPPRSLSPLPGPPRRPLSPRSRVRELDRRQREERREEERNETRRTRGDSPVEPANEHGARPPSPLHLEGKAVTPHHRGNGSTRATERRNRCG